MTELQYFRVVARANCISSDFLHLANNCSGLFLACITKNHIVLLCIGQWLTVHNNSGRKTERLMKISHLVSAIIESMVGQMQTDEQTCGLW
jgi:hypothetical protein